MHLLLIIIAAIILAPLALGLVGWIIMTPIYWLVSLIGWAEKFGKHKKAGADEEDED